MSNGILLGESIGTFSISVSFISLESILSKGFKYARRQNLART